jgi:hypothetical protein
LIEKEKAIKKAKKIVTHSKDRLVKRGKIECHPQIMCGGDIRILLNVISHYINEFNV